MTATPKSTNNPTPSSPPLQQHSNDLNFHRLQLKGSGLLQLKAEASRVVPNPNIPFPFVQSGGLTLADFAMLEP